MDSKRKSNGTNGDVSIQLTKKMKQDTDIEIQEEDIDPTLAWGRPKVPHIDPKTYALDFQQLEVDYTVGEPVDGMPGSKVGPVPIIRLFGSTMEGYSVLANVHGVAPYFYVAAPMGFTQGDCDRFRVALNRSLQQQCGSSGPKIENYVLSVEIIQKTSILNYAHKQKKSFISITLLLPKHVTPCRNILKTGFNYGTGTNSYITYESNYKIVGCSWISVIPGRYKLTPKPASSCQIEIDIDAESFVAHAPEGEWAKVAPFRILSFDIECAGRKGVFPEAEHDPVIQIANLVTRIGESKPFVKNVFTVGETSSIVGAQVISCKKEGQMLIDWKRFIQKVDPDIIIGYNIANFDFPYLVERAKVLKLDEFLYLGKIQNARSHIKAEKFSSKAYAMDGRVAFDVLQVVQREFKLRSYTLNSVSAEYLGEQKEDVQPGIISDLHNGTPDDRRRLASYCLKDAYLPQRLVDRLMLLVNYIEMARVTGIPLGYLLSRGQQIKVVSQLYRKALEDGYVIPVMDISPSDDKYEGATVMVPKTGFYKKPISTLDFTSLYPSIMMAHNLCYTTLLTKRDMALLSPDQYEVTPLGDAFVKAEVHKGLLPRILEDLLGARKKAKTDLANEKDPARRAVLDGRQLALKISANSVYGFTGATVGKLPLLEISAGVTAYGRVMIEKAKKLVEDKYTVEHGYPFDAEVIYGDTDSVMVKFGVDDVSKAMELGREAAHYVTQHFRKPINLDFEKVYFPYLLMKKKRYAGLLWTKPDKHDKMDAKGIETVRRDNCGLVRDVISNCLKKILIDGDEEAAKDYTKQVISDLLQNRLDLSLLVISKALSKEGKSYTNKQAHVELAERMKKRDQGTAPGIGDRIPYVIIQGPKDARTYEKSEDPIYVLEHGKPLDYQYYVDNQLRKPLLRIFEPIMAKPEQLLYGDHTRTISRPTPKDGGIIGFTVKQATCVGCRVPLRGGDKTVCKQCKPKAGELYYRQLANVTDLENKFGRAWTQCQRCSGSLHQPVLCTNRDCPIFYMRTKVQKDLSDAQEQLAKFDIEW